MQGSLDRVTEPEKAELTYPLLETPRALMHLNGADHYGIRDESDPAGARPDPFSPALGQAKSNLNAAR